MAEQDIYLEEVRGDIREIKSAIKDLAAATITLALHSQKLDTIEASVSAVRTDLDKSWDEIRNIQRTCLLREGVYRRGSDFFEKELKEWHNQDDWLNLLLGSALRNGIWIAVAALVTAIINRHFWG